MPNQRRWIKFEVNNLQDNSDCWVFVAWFLSIAKVQDFGVVDHSVLDSSDFESQSGLDHEAAKSQVRAALKKGLICFCEVSGSGYGRVPKARTLIGWRHFAWESVLPDSRVKKRDVKVLPFPTFRHFTKKSVQKGYTLVDVVDKAISCMSIGGKSTRVLSLDSVSLEIIKSLISDHGAESVMKALDDCGGSSRPAYMLKKVMSKNSKSRSSVPTREEWLKG